MCGRMTLTWRDLDSLADELDAVPVEAARAEYRPRYNVAPTDRHPIVLLARPDEGAPGGRRRTLVPAGWGFLRLKSGKGPRAGKPRPPLFNARAESAADRDAFGDAFVDGRCLVPADGFFEWSGEGESRRPFWLHRPDGKLLLLAGLCERITRPGPNGEPGAPEWRFTVLTTAANRAVGRLHDRMPVILAPEDAEVWLRDGPRTLLRPAPEDCLVATPVSRRVNSVRNDDAANIAPEVMPGSPAPLGEPGAAGTPAAPARAGADSEVRRPGKAPLQLTLEDVIKRG